MSLLVALSLLPAVSSFQVDAQSSASAPQPVSGAWALVSARIVDGSGNEPFEGTIVVRDGRIVEAGRTVKPPADARIVDAQGRTVTTGLIDLHVQLPAGASDDQIARALGAYVYAGVTTIAVSGVEPGAFDGLREKLQAKGLPAPRLVAARADGASAVAPGLARAAQVAQRQPTTLLGEMVSATRFQQAQAAGDATAAGREGAAGAGAAVGGAAAGGAAAGGAAGTGAAAGAATAGGGDAARWQAAVDKVKALRTANVRLAIAAGAGEGGLPHGWSSLLDARLLSEAGLTPLQAVTAATSGGAWALGLQSDRAFIAVGQRADLVVFNGNPTSSIGDIEKIERVFLGGQEVDRAALRTFLTRDDPPPPPPPAPPTETAANATTTTGATRGAAARKGRRGKAEPATPTTSGSPAGATGSTSGAASATTPAGTPAPGAATTGATAAGATPGSTTSGAPTSGTAAPASGATTSPASGATAPATGSTTAAESSSGGASVGGAGIMLDNPLIDDFETTVSRGNLGAAWQTRGDASTQPATIIAGRVIRGLRDHALHLTARMGDASQPYAAVNVRVGSEDGRPADVSRFRGVRFDARGEGRYRIVFITRGVTDGHYHVTYFSGSPIWTPVSVPFASIGQNGSSGSKTVPWTGRDLIEISFQVARDPGQMGWLELDNVRFY